MAAPLTLWFDFASPYAYFALDAVERLADAHGRGVVWRPMLLWAVLKAQNIPPPMDAPPKRAYFLADMERSAAFHGLPYRAPSRFALSSHRAARLYYALAEDDSTRARAVGREILAAYFQHDADIGDVATLARIGACHGMTHVEAAATVESELGRRRLAEANEAAIAAGVCGSPWIIVDDEAFFGVDRLPQIAWRLSGSPEGVTHERI
jgi:2-hydroxychromene-2-carboxylate isomerase